MLFTALLSASLLVASASASACSPPGVGTPVQSLDCATSGATLQFAFNLTNKYSGQGTVNVAGSGLCLAVLGTIPDDGAPAIAMDVCKPTAREQNFAFMLSGTVVSALNGQCWDLESGNKAPNERLEVSGSRRVEGGSGSRRVEGG